MNKDLLIKLTKLANHNPNDHEANSAARRVCKMLEEANFELTDTVPPKSDSSNRYSYYNSDRTNSDYWKDIFDYFHKQWYDPPPKDTAKTWNDVNRSREPEFKAKPYTYQSPKERPEKRWLVCKTCKKKSETRFVGAEELFECDNCQWTAYTREKAERK